MKNIIKLSLIFTVYLFSACEDEPIGPNSSNPTVQEVVFFSVTIPDNYFRDEPNTKQTQHIYITDEDGHLIADTALTNNATFEIKRPYDSLKRFDVTILDQWINNGDTNYTFHTITNYSNNPFTYFKNDFGAITQLDIKVINLGNALPELGGYSYSFSGGNGGILDFTAYLPGAPNDKLYANIKSGQENFWRYLWLENLSGTTVGDIDFTTLPTLPNSNTITFPASDIFTGSLTASPASSDLFYPLKRFNEAPGSTSATYALPDNFFQDFILFLDFTIGNKRYALEERGSTLSQNYATPSFDYQIIDNTLNNFEITTTGNFDYSSVGFLAEYGNNRVRWIIHDEAQNTVKPFFPNLESTIIALEPNFSLSDLTYSFSQIIKYNGSLNHSDYIKHNILFDKRHISRYESVSIQ